MKTLKVVFLVIGVHLYITTATTDKTSPCYGRIVSPGVRNATKALTIGGMFAVHQSNSKQRTCPSQTGSPPRFNRFAVEQTEAMILATEAINSNTTFLTTRSLDYVIWDTCGFMENAQDECGNEAVNAADSLVEDSNAIAIVLGPFYGTDLLTQEKTSLKVLYKTASKSLNEPRGVFPLLHFPIPLESDGNLRASVVYLSQSCVRQAEAAFDFLVEVGWNNASFVASGDGCGDAALKAFAEMTRLHECGLNVTYYQEKPGSALADVSSVHWNLSDVWRSDSPGVVVLLSSTGFARDVLDEYLSSNTSTQTFGFLLGDFWGDSELADLVYDRVTTLARVAGRVASLRAHLNGFAKIQDHMTSLRSNSSQLLRNGFLLRFWESHFNCSVKNQTCNTTASLKPITRPILRNNEAVLTIDAVYLVAFYFNIDPTFNSFNTFKTVNTIFKVDSSQGLPESINLTYLSWTGNLVHLFELETYKRVSFGDWWQRATWEYDILSLRTPNNSADLNYSVLTQWLFESGKTSLRRPLENLAELALPGYPVVICPVPATPTPNKKTQTTTTALPFNGCSSNVILPLVTIPVLTAVALASFTVFLIRSERRAALKKKRPTYILIFITSVFSILLSLLTITDVFGTLTKCHALVGDFLINSNNLLFIASVATEILSQTAFKRFKRNLLWLEVLFNIIVSGIGILLAGLSSFAHYQSPSTPFDNGRCFDLTSLLIASYIYPAVIAFCCALTSVCIKVSHSSRIWICSVTASLFLALAYLACVVVTLWGSLCYVQTAFLALIALFPAAIDVMLLSILVCVMIYHRKHRARLSSAQHDAELICNVFDKSKDVFDVEFWDSDVRKQIESVCILPERIKMGLKIGKGNFGEVFRGSLDEKVDIALKSTKDGMNRRQLNEFVREGLQMRHFEHPNVMELYGICWSNDPFHPYHRSPLIVLPFMELGDLKTYLRQCRPGKKLTLESDAQKRKISLVQLVKFAHQIAKGMDYISQKGIVHRDLAARNCMVNFGLEIKVADFGLSRVMKEGQDYYRTGAGGQLPVRWMSLESLLDFVFTAKSDIWSFGVTLWEVMTLAMVPYPGVANQEVVPFLKSGNRLEKPDACPQEVYNLMLQCWATEPDDRPSFSEVICELEEYLMELANYFNPNASDGVEEKKTDPYVNWSLATGYNEAEEARLEKNNAKDETKDHGDEEDINRDEGASEEVEHGKLDVKSGSGSPE